MNHLVRISGWLLVGAVVLASWTFGRFGPAIIPILAAICLTALVLSMAALPGPAFPGFRRFLPWLAFLALGGVGLVNPAYERVVLPDGPFLSRIPHLEFLPTVVNRGHAALVLLSFAAAMGTIVALSRTAWSRSRLRQQLTVLVVNAAVISLTGLAGKLLPQFTFLGLLPQTNTLPFATFDYHNNWTGFAVPALAMALGLIETRWIRSMRWGQATGVPFVLMISIGLIVAGVILSSSRSGLILMTVLTGVACLRMARHLRQAGLETVLGRYLRPNALYFVVLVCGVGAVLYAGRGIMKSRWDYTRMQVEQISEGNRLESRVFLARDTARMALARPILGWGNGSWAYIFPSFAGPEFSFNGGADRRSFPFAHDDWLQLIAENGLVGATALLVVPVWLLITLRRSGRHNPVTFWVLVGIGLVGVLACWDYPFGHPANLLQVALLFGTGVASSVLEKRIREGSGDE
ncbi:MAG: O-antigen ligase family protein [Opitutaceae bacterium]